MSQDIEDLGPRKSRKTYVPAETAHTPEAMNAMMLCGAGTSAQTPGLIIIIQCGLLHIILNSGARAYSLSLFQEHRRTQFSLEKKYLSRKSVCTMCRQCLCVVRVQCVVGECVFGMCRQFLCVVRVKGVVGECVFGMCRQCLCDVRGLFCSQRVCRQTLLVGGGMCLRNVSSASGPK